MKNSESIDIYIDKSSKNLAQFNTALKQASYRRTNGKAETPKKKLLQDIYENSFLDTHLTACVNNRKSNVLAENFVITSENGLVNEEKTKLFKSKKWFNDFINEALNSIYFGYSLIELSDINENGELSSITLIPRANSIPEIDLLLKKPNDKEGIIISDFDDYVFVKANNLNGLLEKVTPLVLYKRFVLAQWQAHSESFALPTIVGKTSVADEKLFQNMLQNLASIGKDKIIGLDKEDSIEFVKPSNDVYLTFRAQIEIINQEISKCILGSTLTIENNNSGAAGSYNLSTTHKDSLLQLIQEDIEFIEILVNDTLIPKLKNIGGKYSILDETDNFKVDIDLRPDSQTLVNLYTMLLNHYEVSEEQIEKEFGIKADMLKKKQIGS